MGYPANIPAVRAEGVPAYDERTLDSNFGTMINLNIDTRFMWDKHGPITEPEALKAATNKYTYMCYAMNR